jgi:hypothetical protein
LSFCEGTLWAGVQNEGGAWHTVATGPGTVDTPLSDRVIIGTSSMSDGFSTILEFFYLTREQAESSFVCGAGKELSGTVAGVTGVARVAMARSTASTDGNFTLRNIPNGAVDLVATYANKVIVRRAQNYTGTVPLLDFASAEPFPLDASTVAFNATGISLSAWSTEIITSTGTRAALANGGASATTQVYSMPATRLEPGDKQHLLATAGSGEAQRFAESFYSAAPPQSLSFGPAGNHPSFNTSVAAGQLWQVTVTSQPEYGGQVVLIVYPPFGSSVESLTIIRATREYFGGTPASWTFTVPDLFNVAGFSESQVEEPGTWECTVSGRPWRSPFSATVGSVYLTGYSHN